MPPLSVIGMLLALMLAACADLIGIEEARYDPSVEPDAYKASEGSCEGYCEGMEGACQGELTQYPDRKSCLEVCRRLPTGSAYAEENSLACRLKQLELAEIEPVVHCAFAGPGGDGECGANCEGFCAIMLSTCSADTSDAYYDDLDQCLTDCASLDELGDYGVERPATKSGDHVECRLYHVTAATLDAEHHCPHAKGTAPCVREQ